MVRANIDESRRPWRRERPSDGCPSGPARRADAARGALGALRRAPGLPEQQRKVVVLRHWLGLSVRETAAELGISEGTVKSHSSRGLAALEAVLAPQRHALSRVHPLGQGHCTLTGMASCAPTALGLTVDRGSHRREPHGGPG